MTVKLHIQLEAIREAGYYVQNENDHRDWDESVYVNLYGVTSLQFYRAMQLASNMMISNPELILQWGESHYDEGNKSETD